MRDLIASALTRSRSAYDVVATAGTAAEAVAVCERLEPHVLILDIDLPDRTGVAAVSDIKRVSPKTRILLCTAHSKEDWFGQASTCGADGFVEKTNSWDDFLTAVDRVSKGQRYFCCAGGRAVTERPERQSSCLSPREQEVLKLIAAGMTTKEIASQLFISVPTVETHRANILKKTGARNVAALVRYAIESQVATAANRNS